MVVSGFSPQLLAIHAKHQKAHIRTVLAHLPKQGKNASTAVLSYQITFTWGAKSSPILNLHCSKQKVPTIWRQRITLSSRSHLLWVRHMNMAMVHGNTSFRNYMVSFRNWSYSMLASTLIKVIKSHELVLKLSVGFMRYVLLFWIINEK